MVGELHSLTDWHVSEASDDAELDDFYSTKIKRTTFPSFHFVSILHMLCLYRVHARVKTNYSSLT